jgi:hypothetical protein
MEVILDRIKLAREASMLTDADRGGPRSVRLSRIRKSKNGLMVGAVALNGPCVTGQNVSVGKTARTGFATKSHKKLRSSETLDAPIGARKMGTKPSNLFREFLWLHTFAGFFNH